MRIVRIILVISLLLLPDYSSSNAQSNTDPDSKISALLARQIDLKLEAAAAASPGKALKALDASGANTGELQSQLVYLYMAKPPDGKQISELQSLGMTVYPDSWIPPVGIHPYGFLLTKMPVNQLRPLAEKTYALKLNTAEKLFQPLNDLAATRILATSVWTSGYNGSGVKVAVLDSGLEYSTPASKHPDIPVPVGFKDYSNYPASVDDTIRNTVTGHGTHVAGSVLGRGTNSTDGKYRGVAWGADLIFLKVGRDDGAIPSAGLIKAIQDAVDVYGADIINMSLGGSTEHQDGTGPLDQAVDLASSKGAVVFAAAGNEANDDQHYSGTVGPAPSGPGGAVATPPIHINITGSNGNNVQLGFNLVWYDGLGINKNLYLIYEYRTPTQVLLPTPIQYPQDESPRGTEHKLSYYPSAIATGSYTSTSDITYSVQVVNTTPTTQDFHIYFVGQTSEGAKVTFQSPDPNYTTGSPALADGAIAVGANVTRKPWTNYKGSSYSYSSETLNTLATFSSRGPRVDTGAPPKPDIIAPGSAIISLRDRDMYLLNSGADGGIIDNDGLNIGPGNSGPADYYVMQGTSMASPVAAGAAALLLQAKPSLRGNPAAVRTILQQTAGNNGVYYASTGYGMLNVQAALARASSAPGPVGSLTSPTHSTGTWSKVNIVTVTWTAASANSGGVLDGYSVLWDQNAGTTPDAIKNVATVTATASATLAPSGNWYFHIRPVDNIGNWASASHLGPFQIDTASPAAPSLSTPSAGGTISTASPTFAWGAVSDISGVSYSMQVATIASFSSALVDQVGIATTTYTTGPFLQGTYHWRVRATDGAGNDSPYATASFSISQGNVTATTALSDGWNMIALPLSPSPATIGYQLDEMGPSVIIYNYNTDSRSYVIYNSSASMSSGMGYWVKVSGNVPVSFEGIPTGTGGAFTIPLAAGWNQIGYPFSSVLPLSSVRVRYQGQEVDLATAAANGWINSVFYEYSPSSRQYIMPDQLSPFKGYWVKANVAAELLIPPPP